MATYPVPDKLKSIWSDTRRKMVETFQSIPPTLIDTVIGQTPQDAYASNIMGAATGGGATRIDAPTSYMRNMIDTLSPGAQPRPINQALEAALPLIKDPVAQQRIIDLMMQVGR